MTGISTTLNRVASYFSGISNAFAGQTKSQARLNAIASYDQSNELFKVNTHRISIAFVKLNFSQAFLSKEMMYSCALWGEAEHGVRGDLTHGSTEGDLEAAQLRKIHAIINKARLRPGDRLLEIGSGWGALSVEVSYHVFTLTT